jgi:hypothetical protein
MNSPGGGGSCIHTQLCRFARFIPHGITFTTPSTAAAAIEKYIEFHMRIDSACIFFLVLIIFECNLNAFSIFLRNIGEGKEIQLTPSLKCIGRILHIIKRRDYTAFQLIFQLFLRRFTY